MTRPLPTYWASCPSPPPPLSLQTTTTPPCPPQHTYQTIFPTAHHTTVIVGCCPKKVILIVGSPDVFCCHLKIKIKYKHSTHPLVHDPTTVIPQLIHLTTNPPLDLNLHSYPIDNTSQHPTQPLDLHSYPTGSETFPTESGVRYGSVLSPILFIIYMDKVMKVISQIEGETYCFAYADDIAQPAKTKAQCLTWWVNGIPLSPIRSENEWVQNRKYYDGVQDTKAREPKSGRARHNPSILCNEIKNAKKEKSTELVHTFSQTDVPSSCISPKIIRAAYDIYINGFYMHFSSRNQLFINIYCIRRTCSWLLPFSYLLRQLELNIIN